MNLTPEQKAAIHTHDRNLIVVAGAGSGKTFVLVERFLALLDAHDDWELNQLVAITFTQKAAQEMRDRVRLALLARMEAAQRDADDVRAALWARRVSAMDSARIDTIHALCAAILRQNAAEAAIDPRFEVLDETGARLLLETVIDDLLAALARSGDPVTRLFREYAAHDIRRALIDQIALPVEMPPADLFERWQAAWEQGAAAELRALTADAPFVQAAHWTPPGGRPSGGDKLIDVWRSCDLHLPLLLGSDDLHARLSALRQLPGAINLTGGSVKAWGNADTLAEAKAALRTLRERAKLALDRIGEPPGDADRRAAELLPLWAALLRLARSAYGDAKRDQGALDFDDLEAAAARLLASYPQARARYQGDEFKHLLVDEFQDTNAAQWQIVRALADPAQPGGLFLVGDAKQSIYGFRGADVSVFDRVRVELQQLGGQEIALARSFRTHAPLVDGFNHIFQQVLQRDPNSPAAAYQVVMDTPMQAARTEVPDDQPYIELMLIDRTGSESDGEDAATLARRSEAYAIAERIERMRADGAQVYDRHLGGLRPLEYHDCALLFRSMTAAPIYEEVFKDVGLPFVTVAGRGYYERQEVWDILNLLRALHNPQDDLALAAALRSPLFALSDDALFALRLRRDEAGQMPSLWQALTDPTGVPTDEHARLAFARHTLSSLGQLAGRVSIADLIEAALEATHFLAVLTGLPDGARRRGNIEKLLEKARTSGRLTLGEFARYLGDLTALEAREGEATLDTECAVVLMTVHKSKGLEYPIIFLADAGRETSGRDGVLMADGARGLMCRVYDTEQGKTIDPYAYRALRQMQDLREEAESRRLLYVAATRAQDRLIISGQAQRKKDGAWSVKGWLRTLVDLFGLGDVDGDGDLDGAWGRLRLRLIPVAERDQSASARDPRSTASSFRVWDDPDHAPQMPPLLARVRVERDAPARSLTATQIADLGSFAADPTEKRYVYRQRLLRSLLRESPPRVERVVSAPHGVSPRRIGEIVHRALRAWRFPTPHDDLSTLLRNYAWEEGIVEPGEIAYAVGEARRLLDGFRRSDLYPMIDQAHRAGRHYAELPFIFQTDRRTIYGKLDALVQTPDGAWVVIDYKSSTVRGGRDHALLSAHARRYHLQVGVYAAAVQRQLGGQIPAVYLHYIRYNHSIRVPAEAWQAALDTMETIIGDALG